MSSREREDRGRPRAKVRGSTPVVRFARAPGLGGSTELTPNQLAATGQHGWVIFASGVAVALGLVHVPHGRGLGILAAGGGSAIIAVVVGVLAAPGPLARGLGRLGAGRPGRLGNLARSAQANVPTLRAALARSGRELRHPHPALLGAVAWWAFDIAVLFVMLHAFGAAPHVLVLVLAYFLGTTCNVLPLPGSLSGGLAGALVALGTPAAPAIAAVLAYRTVAVWLPAASGVASVARLRVTVAAVRCA